ncbi:glycosyltransferase [Luteimonas sp. MHLX1A]|uniref:glycosyltransferase n=1 Tax=Alterluteimonas muca TaxID=2878684 RepID=UPI001E603154|nr:glycosyltransferase [Luteimonas sp. MHLX1A]MCD9047149.1 glycosyltransferase [Luteimonas sp. MHLX1A]
MQQQPLVTFALFAYNQERFIREALVGAVSQDYGRLEIIISDDASSDNTYQIIRDFADSYDGAHDLVLNRNRENLGIGGHVNKIMGLARGEVIVVAAGDDISHPGRVSKVMSVFESDPEHTYSVWSGATYIDDDGRALERQFPGNPSGYTDRSMVRNQRPLIGATHAWRRDVFDFFGPLLEGVVFEDNAISFRSYLLGEIRYVDEKLVSYRTHAENITNFSAVADKAALYAAAARRSQWAMTGLAQRRRDLEVALARTPALERNPRVLLEELDRVERRTARRLEAYRQFPRLTWRTTAAAAKDPEIAKLLLRSVQAKLQGVGSAA